MAWPFLYPDWMTKTSVLMALLLATAGWGPPRAWAQVAGDTLVQGWEVDAVGTLNASQAAYRNWTEGGLNVINFTAGTSGQAIHRSAAWEKTYDLRLAFGLVKQDTLDFRKADDVIALGSTFRYLGAGFFRTFNPTLSATARTQFAEGFNYDRNPLGDGRPPPVKVSDFFSPATFTQSAGLTYSPAAWFRQRLALASKETVVYIPRLRPLYGLEADQGMRYEIGLESRTEVDREVFENVRLRSSLGLFASFNQTELPDLIWENLVVMKVNAWLSTNFEFVTLYDRDLSRRLQLKEVFALGISVTLL